MRVLILEDDPIQLALETNWLRANGHEVTPAADGQAAIEALARGSCDVAVLDWMVPGVSGHDVLRWIRGRGMALPILFATTCGEEFEVASTLSLGADDYVVKPLRAMEFVARVEALARRARGTAAPALDRAW